MERHEFGIFGGSDSDRGLTLGDIRNARCGDGLTPRGVNHNCGAESALDFHPAHQTITDSFWKV